MDAELPTSPLLVRLFAEGPWTLAMPLIALAAALAWWGSRRDQARPILVGVGLLLAAAATLGGAALWTSPGEHAAERVRVLVAAAEAGDVAGIRACFDGNASMHYGSPDAPGDDLDRLMAAAESLAGRHRIERNDVTRLDCATAGDDRGIVILGCRTQTASSYGPVPTRWWIEVVRGADGEWRIDRLAWLQVLDRTPERDML